MFPKIFFLENEPIHIYAHKKIHEHTYMYLFNFIASSAHLDQLQKEFWKWHMQDQPEFMSATGFHKHDDLLDSYNMSMFETRKVGYSATFKIFIIIIYIFRFGI